MTIFLGFQRRSAAVAPSTNENVPNHVDSAARPVSAPVVGVRVTGRSPETIQFEEVVLDVARTVSVVRGVFVPDPSGTALPAAA